jgi:hypothetical protein
LSLYYGVFGERHYLYDNHNFDDDNHNFDNNDNDNNDNNHDSCGARNFSPRSNDSGN